jgi:hypothetical protein
MSKREINLMSDTQKALVKMGTEFISERASLKKK